MDVREKTTSKKRLIDADALLNEFLKRYTEMERNRNLVFAACEIKQDFADMISDFPTVDAVEVVNGRWEPGNPICPVCGGDKFKDLDADIWADWEPPYCPNCGAKMDGGAD